jgi:hypothetical protein
MKINEMREFAKTWNSLKTDQQRIKMLVENTNKIGVWLDNDSTNVSFLKKHDFEDESLCLESFENWFGNCEGVYELMKYLNIKVIGG